MFRSLRFLRSAWSVWNLFGQNNPSALHVLIKSQSLDVMAESGKEGLALFLFSVPLACQPLACQPLAQHSFWAVSCLTLLPAKGCKKRGAAKYRTGLGATWSLAAVQCWCSWILYRASWSAAAEEADQVFGSEAKVKLFPLKRHWLHRPWQGLSKAKMYCLRYRNNLLVNQYLIRSVNDIQSK